MGEGYAVIHQEVWKPVVEGGGSMMTHSAGSVTTPSIAYNNVMAPEPYSYT